MLEDLLRVITEVGLQADWLLVFCAVVVAVFVVYIGVALVAALRASDEGQREVRYKIFTDLLGLFRRGSHK